MAARGNGRRSYWNACSGREIPRYAHPGEHIDPDGGGIAGIATAYQQLGETFQSGNNPDSALKYYQLTLGIDQRLGVKIEEAGMLLQLGNIYKDMRNDSAATRVYEQGRGIARAIGDSARFGTTSRA